MHTSLCKSIFDIKGMGKQSRIILESECMYRLATTTRQYVVCAYVSLCVHSLLLLAESHTYYLYAV